MLNDDVVRAARERDKDAEDGGEARFGKFSVLREEVQAFGARGLALTGNYRRHAAMPSLLPRIAQF